MKYILDICQKRLLTKKNHLNINNEIIKLSELKKKFENNFFNYINN